MNTEELYNIAYKDGKKEMRRLMEAGKSLRMPVLDEILLHENYENQIPLGVVDLPLDRIAGTKTAGRSESFSPGFMPLMENGTEFASKWQHLCDAHLNEGIRDPILVYEYKNLFYVAEGNKRVSVLKTFRARTIRASVTRILPARDDSAESQAYYEFLDFYNVTKLMDPVFSRPGSYQLLNDELGYQKGELWKKEDILNLRSAFDRFSEVYRETDLNLQEISVGDAMRHYMSVYSYPQMLEESVDTLTEHLQKLLTDVKIQKEGTLPIMKYDPSEKRKSKSIFRRRTSGSEIHKIAFLYQGTPETDAWSYAHEQGRLYLAEHFGSQIQTSVYNNVSPEDVYDTILRASHEGNDLILTTAPVFLTGSVRAAIEQPNLRILNCSLDTSHSNVRTYYGRIFEITYMLGMLAAMKTKTDQIGYIADLPIRGMIANINAFARGVKTIRPEATVHLTWSTQTDCSLSSCIRELKQKNTDYIANFGMIDSSLDQFGLMDANTGEILCHPTWRWGKYYEIIIQNILDGIWEEDNSAENALNYWWGLSADVIGINRIKEVPKEQEMLLRSVEHSLRTYKIYPFEGELTDQSGTIHFEKDRIPEADEINCMNWLLDNISGAIPSEQDIKEKYKLIVQHGQKNE